MQTIFFVLVYTEYAYLYLFSHCRGGYLFPFLKGLIVKYMYMFVSDVHAGIDYIYGIEFNNCFNIQTLYFQHFSMSRDICLEYR